MDVAVLLTEPRMTGRGKVANPSIRWADTKLWLNVSEGRGVSRGREVPILGTKDLYTSDWAHSRESMQKYVRAANFGRGDRACLERWSSENVNTKPMGYEVKEKEQPPRRENVEMEHIAGRCRGLGLKILIAATARAAIPLDTDTDDNLHKPIF